MATSDRSHLVLGWRTTPTLDPAYWQTRSPQSGHQADSDLVTVPAEAIGCHTAVVAQSGSGKSFFLGRLIEEITLKTRARCVIIDPNADFRRIHEVADASLWATARYDTQSGRGKLPHEKSRAEFAKHWRRGNVRIRTADRMASHSPYQKLQVSWHSLSMDVLAEDIEPMLRTDLYHCHSFVRELAELHDMKAAKPVQTKALIDHAEELLRQARSITESVFRTTLEAQFNVAEILRASPRGKAPRFLARFFHGPPPSHVEPNLLRFMREMMESRVSSLIESLVRMPQYISPVIEHFYFSRARSYEMAGVITPLVEFRGFAAVPAARRLEVIDLPSLKDQGTRLLAINDIMTTEWQHARDRWVTALRRDASRDDRAPVFIVIDEAHNLIPEKPRSKAEGAVREIFRTIAAEGRKYGLFMIMVSQRPDKLDPLVLSECDNKLIMKLSSGSVLSITRNLLGLDDIHPKMLERCLDFGPGRALLVGRWSPGGPQFMFCAARRTVEGGRNLREAFWAVPGDIFGARRPRRRKKGIGRKGRK